MATYKCLLSHPLGDGDRQRLVEGLAAITIDRFGSAGGPVEVEFTEVEAGRWFTAAEPSSATMVLGSVPPGTSQEDREAHMDTVASFVAHTMDEPLDHIMVVAADARPSTTPKP